MFSNTTYLDRLLIQIHCTKKILHSVRFYVLVFGMEVVLSKTISVCMVIGKEERSELACVEFSLPVYAM